MTLPEQPVNPGSFAAYEERERATRPDATHDELSLEYGKNVAEFRDQIELLRDVELKLIDC